MKLVFRHNNGYAIGRGSGICWDARLGVMSEFMLISPGNNSKVIISDIILATDTILEYTFIPGSGTGDMYIGNQGVSSVSGNNDSNDFRFFLTGGTAYSDVGRNRANVPFNYDNYLSSKIHVVQGQNNTTASLMDGTVILSLNYSQPSFSNNGACLLIDAINGMKIYDIKVTKNNVTVFDADVRSDGLYDNVSKQFINTGWAVAKET